jgi:hypothetical protein
MNEIIPEWFFWAVGGGVVAAILFLAIVGYVAITWGR